MRQTTAHDDNVFDFNALLPPFAPFSNIRATSSRTPRYRFQRNAQSWRPGHRTPRRSPPARRCGRRAGLKAPVTIDEILEALCELDGPRNPPGGKPNRLCSTDRALAA